MKNIFLIRHAKSDWSIPGLSDIDRPLNSRGYADAHVMGGIIKDLKIDSPLLISSNAIRALSTALIFAREIIYPENKILICPELYEAEISDYKNVIQSCNEQFENILMFGHNPGISETISSLSGRDVGEIPTACVYHLTVELTKWQDAFSSKATIRNIYSPKLLSGESH